KPVNYPVDHRTHFVKRCVALPGDTLQIIDHEVYINGVLLPMPQKVQLNYTVKTDTANFKKLHLEKLGLMREGREGKYEMLTMTLTQRQADSLRLVKEIISVDADISRAGLYDEQLFPHSESFPWNLDNYGPVVIPKKGTTVKLTVDSLPIYERIIVNYEHNTMSVKNDSIFVNGKYTTSYTFRMNYFFMMGDNREYSMDSRYWGFVPEDHIVGRAVMILFSYDRKNGHVRWDRCFENIH
ncbi:MAG TPA: signal peptidase I, partial [Bacteroidia bacterium]|nr:signal peptidase I [Bacteroidia bacterium]